MNAIVGYTGFVGSNLYSPDRFRAAYNSKNIGDAYGTEPDLLVYAGVRAEKFLANHDPEKDMENIRQAEENIERIRPRALVLISTIDVLNHPAGADETAETGTAGLHPYGLHRCMLEQWVRGRFPDALIVRLPGLFGRNLKKNFIYDYIHRIPSMLKADQFAELAMRDPRLEAYYPTEENGFRKAAVPDGEQEKVRNIFTGLGFSALNFTDSRSRFQFYNLGRLWGDLQTALKNNLKLLHLATEPVTAGEVYRYLTGEDFVNELDSLPADYDFRTCHARLFGAEKDYICDRAEVLKEIGAFVNQ